MQSHAEVLAGLQHMNLGTHNWAHNTHGPGLLLPSWELVSATESSLPIWLLSIGNNICPEMTSDNATATRGIGGNSTQNEHDSLMWHISQHKDLSHTPEALILQPILSGRLGGINQ